jgi:antibiotic biosynthesis monooxygenase (ABM) superfamily enzyme
MTTATIQVNPAPARPAPSRLRFAAFVLLFVYPLVTGLQYALMPLTADWPLPARTAIFVPLMVAAMVWGIIPLIQTRLRRWL